jgi:hypothetical protein
VDENDRILPTPVKDTSEAIIEMAHAVSDVGKSVEKFASHIEMGLEWIGIAICCHAVCQVIRAWINRP